MLKMMTSGKEVKRLQLQKLRSDEPFKGPFPAILHGLPIKFKIHSKILFFDFRALLGQTPNYTFNLLTPHTPARSLRSSDKNLLCVPNQTFTFVHCNLFVYFYA